MTRRLGDPWRYGIVEEVSEDGITARVRWDDLTGDDDQPSVSEPLPIMKERTKGRKRATGLAKDEHVIVLVDANGEDGVILGAIYSDADPPPVKEPTKDHTTYEDGAIIEYDTETHLLVATLPDGGKIHATAPGGFEFTGDVKITGKLDVSDTGSFGAQTTAPEFAISPANLIKLSTHKHPTAGTGPPSAPIP